MLVTLAAGCTSKPQGATAPPEARAGNGTLYLGIMVHLEGRESEAADEGVFREHATRVREYASLFESYGARLTLEAKPEFVEGCINWDDDVLGELYERGHGVGIHADLGAEPGLTQEQFEATLRSMRERMESLGIPVRHASGISSSLDWVKAAREAGLTFVDGVVEYALRSIPLEQLPPEYREAATRPGGPANAHGSVPYDMDGRTHPWRMNSGADWLWHDPQGQVVIIPGSAGQTLPNLAEDSEHKPGSGPSEFTQADIDAFLGMLEEALACSSAEEVNVFYVGWSIGGCIGAGMVERLLQAVQPYIDSGHVEWKTIPEMYDAYVEWESAQAG